MNRKEVITIVSKCLEEFYLKNQILVEKQVREESLTSRLVCSLRNYFEDGIITVDPEYNKHLDGEKKYKTTDGLKKVLRPDIVIHQIGTDDQNLVAFECKKEKIKEEDEVKIDALIRQYGYQFGILVEYNQKRFFICELVDETFNQEMIQL